MLGKTATKEGKTAVNVASFVQNGEFSRTRRFSVMNVFP